MNELLGTARFRWNLLDENGALEASETSLTDVDGDNAKETSSRSPAMEFQILQWQLKGAKETQRSSSTTVFAGHAAIAPSSKLSFHRIPRMWETKITHNKNTRRKRHLLQVFFCRTLNSGSSISTVLHGKKRLRVHPCVLTPGRNLVPKARGNLLLERDLFERNFSSDKKSLWANLSDVGSHGKRFYSERTEADKLEFERWPHMTRFTNRKNRIPT